MKLSRANSTQGHLDHARSHRRQQSNSRRAPPTSPSSGIEPIPNHNNKLSLNTDRDLWRATYLRDTASSESHIFPAPHHPHQHMFNTPEQTKAPHLARALASPVTFHFTLRLLLSGGPLLRA